MVSWAPVSALRNLLLSKPREEEGPLTKEHIQQLPQGQTPNRLGVFIELEKRK